MAMDDFGNLYVSTTPGVLVLKPDGSPWGTIKVPEEPANCTFGDHDYDTLYITARTSLYSIHTATRGWHVHLDGPPAAGKSPIIQK